ncbi:MAG: MmgE/PrpD family protein [Saprospirales bacterium]|nr:MAG: MmgE/PrpD family protein [Saprospirales bacterium]
MINDTTLHSLASFSLNDEFKLRKEVKDAIKLHLIDTFGCAYGGINSKPAEVLRKIASTAKLERGCSVFGLPDPTTPEYAAMANTAMVRYLDFNDTGNGGHPSDVIPVVLALAEFYKIKGSRVLKAIHKIYETYCGLRIGGLYGNLLRKKHIDQIYAVIAGAVGGSYLLGLNLRETANAISLAVTPNIPMRATRTGRISYWKSTATSHSSLMATMAVRLSKEGMTGPEKPFEGSGGFYQMFEIEKLDLSKIGEPIDGRYAIESTGFKIFPANYNALGPAFGVLELRKNLDVESIELVEVFLHWGGWHSQGGGAGDKEAKWNPKTREEAENSMAYVVAVTMLDGKLDYDSFSENRVNSEDIKEFIKKIEVLEDPMLTESHKGALPKWPCRIRVVYGGQTKEVFIESPKGHPLNPISKEDVVSKFRNLIDSVPSKNSASLILESIEKIDILDEIDGLMKIIRNPYL